MATKKRKTAADDFYRLSTLSDPQISPDGKWLAYVLTWPDREEDEMRSAV